MIGNKKQDTQTAFRLPKEELERIDSVVKTRDGGRGLFIREAIREKLQRETKQGAKQ